MMLSIMTRRLIMPSSAASTGSSLIPSVIRYGSHSLSIPKRADAKRNHGLSWRSRIHAFSVSDSSSGVSAPMMGV